MFLKNHTELLNLPSPTSPWWSETKLHHAEVVS